MKKLYVLSAAILMSPIFMNAQSDCTPHNQVSNGVENGSFIEAAFYQIIANDFTISGNYTSFNADELTVNLLSQGGIATVDIFFLADNNGTPGAEIASMTMLGQVPTSQAITGSNFGYDRHEVVFEFATPIEFTGGTYWLQVVPTPTVEATRIAWETTTASTMGHFQYKADGDLPTPIWTTDGDVDGVFSISGECVLAEGCLMPENLSAMISGGTSADISWTEIGDATEWSVEYGAVGYTPGSGTSTAVSGTSSVTISDFTTGSSYDIYVKSICSDGESEYVGPVSIMFDYCAITVSNGVEPITNVVIAGISNTTSANSTADHEYFLEMIATLVPGNTHPIAIEGYTGGDYENSVVVFIDWNGDYEFNNEDERYEIGFLDNTTGTDGAQATGNIVVPNDAQLGATRMRVVKMYTASSAYAPGACGAIGYGQAEDYTVNVDLQSSVNFADFDFKLGPNPTSDIVQITSTENIQSIKVYNLLGQQVLNNQLNVNSPQINMSSLQNGVYLMEVTINDTREVFKIVKQ